MGQFEQTMFKRFDKKIGYHNNRHCIKFVIYYIHMAPQKFYVGILAICFFDNCCHLIIFTNSARLQQACTTFQEKFIKSKYDKNVLLE